MADYSPFQLTGKPSSRIPRLPHKLRLILGPLKHSTALLCLYRNRGHWRSHFSVLACSCFGRVGVEAALDSRFRTLDPVPRPQSAFDVHRATLSVSSLDFSVASDFLRTNGSLCYVLAQ